jgi:hypothetical protein
MDSAQVEARFKMDWANHCADGTKVSWCQTRIDFADADQQLFLHGAAGTRGGGLDRTTFGVRRTDHHEKATA